VAERMAANLGQSIVVDNKPGASSTVGLADALRQPADGYTVYLLASPATLVAPVILLTFKTDIQNSLAPVGLMAWSYNVLIVGANSTYKSPQDIVAAAKAKPGSLSFASRWQRHARPLGRRAVQAKAGMQAVHVPYNQFSMAITDMVSGRLDFMFLTSAAAIPQIAEGKLRALAASSTSAWRRCPRCRPWASGFPEVVVRSFEMMTVKHGTRPGDRS
jgi:tripartite-type tricarboxylate transporter receptor subunit TctC